MICNSGIKTVIYRYEYDKFKNNFDIAEMLSMTGVNLIHENQL